MATPSTRNGELVVDPSCDVHQNEKSIDGRSRREGSISDIYRQRSSFADLPSQTKHNFFDNLQTLMDSPTASATTFSHSSGSPYGYDSGRSSQNYSPTISMTPTTPVTPATPDSKLPSPKSSYGLGYNNTMRWSNKSNNRMNRSSSDSSSSPNYSISSSNVSSIISENTKIDHTALLLGFRDEFGAEETMSDDDEREWNACFLSPNASLDEGDDGNGSGTIENASVEESIEDESVCVHLGGKFVHSDFDNERELNDNDIGGTSSDDAKVDISRASLRDLTVNCTHDDSKKPLSALAYLEEQNSHFPGLTYNPAWANDEGEEEDGTRKNTYSLENKRWSAAMKALAMKERASSALVAKTQKAKAKVNKMKTRKVQNQHHQQQPHRLPPRDIDQTQSPNGMEITTLNCYGDRNEVLSQVSTESSGCIDNSIPASKRSSFKSNKSKVTNSAKPPQQVSGNSIASKSKRSSRSTSAISAVTSMKDKASSALSQKAHRAKEKTMGMVPVSKLMKMQRQQRQVMVINKTQSGLSSVLPSSQRYLDAGYSSDIISLASNSEAPSIYSSSVPLRRDHVPDLFDTPQATFKKSNLGGLEVIGNSNTIDTLKQSNIIIGSPIMLSPPPITRCPSNVSSHNANSSNVSCIDTNGFLISPTSSMDGLADAGGLAACSSILSTVGSEGAFDPNSFLFLSPLSNTDMDDPDYGMPDLLSRSNSHNAAVLDPAPLGSADSATGTAISSQVSSTKSSRTGPKLFKNPSTKKLIPRLPPSPSLPPSGKKIMKKLKGGRGNNNSTNYEYGYGSNYRTNDGTMSSETSARRHHRPPRDRRRSFTSEF